MTTVPVLVLSRRHSDDSNALWRAAVGAGWDVERLRGYEAPCSLIGREVALYGETLMADAVTAGLGIALIEPSPDWLTMVPMVYRKRAVAVVAFEQVRARAERRFVKPCGEKDFSARVYEANEVITVPFYCGDEPVLVSDPVRFGLEVRSFVLDRKVVTLSAYMRAGELARDASGAWPLTWHEVNSARDFLNELLFDPAVALPPAVVIDIGWGDGLGWIVVEANPCWASGICGCDPVEVLRVVRRATVRAANITDEDRPWLRPKS